MPSESLNNVKLRIKRFAIAVLSVIQFCETSIKRRSLFGFKTIHFLSYHLNLKGHEWQKWEVVKREIQSISLAHNGDPEEYRSQCEEHWKYRNSTLSDSLIIGDDFTKYIGHLGFGLATRIYHEMANPKTIPQTKIVYSQSCNSHLLESYFSDYFSVVKLQNVAYETLLRLDVTRFENPAYIYTYGGAIETTQAQASFGDYVKQFEISSGYRYPGIFSLKDEDMSYKNSILQHFGLDTDQDFVVVHIKNPNPFSFRGADPNNYVPCIEHILNSGKAVFFLGESTELTKHFRNAKNFFDLQLCKLRSPRMDLVLLSSCSLALVTTSGPHTIPSLFGRPTLWTNAIGIARYLYFPHCTFIPKLFKKEGELITLSQMAKEPKKYFIDNNFNASRTDSYEIFESTPDEILDAFINLQKSDFFPVHNYETTFLESVMGRRTSVVSNSFVEKNLDWFQ